MPSFLADPHSDDPAALRARIEDLEVRVAFQERTIGELDGLVATLFSRIESLEARLGQAEARLEAPLVGGGPPGPADERPPHYGGGDFIR